MGSLYSGGLCSGLYGMTRELTPCYDLTQEKMSNETNVIFNITRFQMHNSISRLNELHLLMTKFEIVRLCKDSNYFNA